MTTIQENKIYPTGPSVPHNIDTTEEFFTELRTLLEQYGDIFRIYSPNGKADGYLVNHPDYIKHVLVKNHQNYKKGAGFDRVELLLGNGLIVSDGPFWRRQRRMIQPAFNKKVIAHLSETITRCNQDLLKEWKQIAGTDTAVNITDTTSKLALEIVLRSLFSDELDLIIEKQGSNPFSILTENAERNMQLVLKFKALTRLLLEVIEYRRTKKPERYDFLAMFMDAVDQETGEHMTNKELVDELTTMIIAGHETSAITLNWVWYFIAKYPQIEHKVHAEVDRASYEEIPSFDDLGQLTYIKQVVNETLRYYPPVWLFTRKAIGDDQLGEYFVPAGTDIFIVPYYLHRNTNFWTDPEKFDPERFSEKVVKQQHSQAYIPFSAGPRRCIGDFFATVEMQIHIGLMARQFSLSLIDEAPIKLEPGVNLRTSKPIFMRISSRK